MHFGGDDYFVSFGEIFQSASENFFTCPYRINIGCIEEIDSQFQSLFDNWTAVLFIQHPFMNPARCIAEPHTAKANA
jgi:hypothetical protein